MKKHFRKEYLVISLSVIALVAGCCSAIAQDTVEARVVDYPQGKASYYVSGSGEPIILLHGAAVSAQTNWSTLVPLLEKERRVININLVGAGNTTFQKDQLSIDDLVALVIAVADAEEAERFSLVGYSTGAVAGLAVAARYPERIDRFITIAPWAVSDARTQSFFLLWERIHAVDPTLFIHFNTHLALSEQTQLQMDAEAFSSTKRNFENAGFNDDLGKVINLLQRVDVAQEIDRISAETLIIGFEDDRIVPAAYAQAIAQRIARATYTTLDAGHGGPWEVPKLMNAKIINFIQ